MNRLCKSINVMKKDLHNFSLQILVVSDAGGKFKAQQ